VATIVTLLLVGAALLLLETVLPGMIAGLVGLGCLIAGVVIAYTDFGLRTGNLVLIIVIVGVVIGTLCWMRFLPDSPMARLFISRGTIGTIGAEKPELLRHTGTALTPLRPSGTAMIDGRRVDVVSEGQLIEKGSRVRVIATEGMRVVVRALDDVEQIETEP
jgi:membrane-bound serine protease (ClpP class)